MVVVVAEAVPNREVFVAGLFAVPNNKELVTEGLLKEKEVGGFETFTPNKEVPGCCCCNGGPKGAKKL